MHFDDKNELLSERLRYIFREFDNVMIAISASVDSTVLLDAAYKIWKKDFRNKRVCVFNLDTEIAHSYSVTHLYHLFETVKDDLDCYWIMLPVKMKHTLFEKEAKFICWDDTADTCLRPIPDLPYVINLDNNPISNYRYRMPPSMLASSFVKWYKSINGTKTAIIAASRTEEKHSTAIINDKSRTYRNIEWINGSFSGARIAYPIFDWTLADLFSAVRKHGLSYNEIYDLAYARGIDLTSFRITPPLDKNDYENIRVFAELDGVIWNNLTKRIKGLDIYTTFKDPRPLYRNTKSKNKKAELLV